MANIFPTITQKGRRHHITVRVTPKSAKGRAMLAKFKKDVRAFHAKWKKAFPKKKN